REMLEAGFTTIRNLSEAGFYGDTALRQAIEEGFVVGPTMINAGRFIIPYGAEAPANNEKPDLNAPAKVEADSPDELLKVVRENIHYGARVIKILVDDTPYVYSTEDLELVVREAGQGGIKVAAHAVTDQGARNAAEAKVASIEHGTRMSPETLEIAKRNGVYVVPTPFTPHLIREMSIRLSGMKHDENFRDADRVFATYVGALKRNYEAGALLAFGSDVGVVSDGWTRGSLAISTIDGWVAAGVPPEVILQALTVNAARLVGVDKERGFIQPGFAADIVATPENPLENVNTLKRVSFVMKEGKVYRHDAPGSGSTSAGSGNP
ncbi:MAG: amidohydrolase family protein, partial [Vicinamibacteria bacterium]